MWELNIAQYFSVSPRDVYVRPFPFLYVPFRLPPPPPQNPNSTPSLRAFTVHECSRTRASACAAFIKRPRDAECSPEFSQSWPWSPLTTKDALTGRTKSKHPITWPVCTSSKGKGAPKSSCDWLSLKSITYQSSCTVGAMATHTATRAQQQRLISVWS